MTQKQIQTTLLDRLESVDLRGTLLFAKAKSSKNFCKDSHFVRIYFLDTSLHCVPLSMTNGGVDSHNNDKFWIASLFSLLLKLPRNDGVGRGFAQGVVR